MEAGANVTLACVTTAPPSPSHFLKGDSESRWGWKSFWRTGHANQSLTSVLNGKQYFSFYLAIIALNAMKYLIMRPTAKDRPVAVATPKAIGFLFRRIMNFPPRRVTPCTPAPHSTELRASLRCLISSASTPNRGGQINKEKERGGGVCSINASLRAKVRAFH